MSRSNKGILEILTKLPWWVSVTLSAVIYIALKWIFPALLIDHIFLKGFSQALPDMALMIALFFLLPAPVSAYHSWRKKRLLDDLNVIKSISELSWNEFEEIVAEIFRRKDYTVIENSGAGPDGGIDITLHKGDDIFLVQCKHWKARKVGVRIVREMYGIMTAEQATGVIVVTSGFFTQEALLFANDKPIKLIAGEQLSSLVEKTQRSNKKTSIAIQKQFLNSCPRCSHQLVLRTARRGQHAGNQFYGCSNYPRCRFTKAIQN
ncbi:MAG: restriction endonuclease [gamma proteobacterium symbiont of Bathyaustriella thionipta]|nr:restriction endonuclease [gamma proteobacterium symbiont of Bathyaustriella thionipta]MCU7951675.1 restriction endonuclease [gamma proteobacterium symbiont of Bathyaustriella thionipta]MCU7958272.1 restriction endonuclease [gamma proteobacterium symbiont of Bathyaustriella thionipta]MCU7968528.1 restriction endonuclease [gamma proteobacterium symbiont of Bathyaustriella thionipta]